MNRALLLAINAALVVACCFLAGRVLASWSGELIAPETTPVIRTASLAPSVDRTWEARQIIISKNLFNASTLTPAESLPTQEEEDLAKTKLPLRLLGTAAHEEPTYSWAAVEDLETREHHVVRVGERLKNRGRRVAHRAPTHRPAERGTPRRTGARREQWVRDPTAPSLHTAPARAKPRAAASASAPTGSRRRLADGPPARGESLLAAAR